MMTSSNGNIFSVTSPLWWESTGHRWFRPQRPVTRSFDVFSNMGLDKRLSKQTRRRWFETLSRLSWRHCNDLSLFSECNHVNIVGVVLCAQWASYQIRKIADCACAGNAGNVFPATYFMGKPLVSDHGMHHGTCVTHVSWCMSGSLTRGGGENVPGIPGACATRNLRI